MAVVDLALGDIFEEAFEMAGESYHTGYDIRIARRALNFLMDEWAIEHEGDITDFPLFDEMEKLGEDKRQKFLRMGLWIKDLFKDAKGIKDEIDTLQRRRKALENKAEKLNFDTEY